MTHYIDLAIWGDLSILVRDRIDLMIRNGLQGITLVVSALDLFLNFRLAFWVAIGIPISFMAAFLALDAFDQTINMISLFAFIMTLGILVDDAIIVGENIFTHYNRGKVAFNSSGRRIKGSRRTGRDGGFNNCGGLFPADVYKRHHRQIYRRHAHGRHHHINRIFG